MKPGPKLKEFPKEVIDLIIKFYVEDKLSMKKISNYLKENGENISKDRVFRILQQRNIIKSKSIRSLEIYGEQIKQAEELLIKGFSLLEICDMLNFKYHILYPKIKKYGNGELLTRDNNAKSKTHKIASNKRRIFNLEEELILVKKYYSGLNMYDLAKEYDVSVGLIYNILHKNNTVIRSYSESGNMRWNREGNLEDREKMRIYGINNYLNKRKVGSKPEEDFKRWLDKNNVNYVEQFRKVGNAHPYDFLLKDYNLLVEIDGHYWHSKEKQKLKDIKHTQDALDKGFNIIRICTKELKEKGNDYSQWITLN